MHNRADQCYGQVKLRSRLAAGDDGLAVRLWL
jgi:hypothetical protein